MIDFLNVIDSNIYLFLNGMHLPFLDRLMMLVTGKFIWVPMYATILLILFKKFKWREALLMTIGLVLAIALADQLCSTVLRPIFHRLRPSNPDNPLSQLATLVNGYRGGKYGFPSCHAANSFAMAIFLFMLIRNSRFRAFIVSWAFLNTYTRVYLGVHYPGDLFVGAIIGSSIGFCMFHLTRFIISKWKFKEEKKESSEIYLPALFSIVGIKNQGVRPSDVMLGIGGFTFMLLMIISIV